MSDSDRSGSPELRTGVFFSTASARHDTGTGHPERPARMEAALAGARRTGLVPLEIAAQEQSAACERLIAAVHSADYAAELRHQAVTGARLFHSVDNPISSGTYEAARAAVGTALTAAEAIWSERRLDRAFVIARPPGHHAERERAMGFCFFNSIACVAERLLELPEVRRVFIFDWDVHHGNGTQRLFEERSDVFYASMHQYPFYPGTGAADERGRENGSGYTLNVPLPAGTGDAVWLRSFETQIAGAIDQFQPDALLISAGFDAHRRDPLASMELSASAFGAMTAVLRELAERHCGGRMLSLLEGGYDLEAISDCVEAHLTELRAVSPR
jgi:acetoin utilization deacetylase AcuC-like enzyme